MGMNGHELLDALERSGAADRTIDLGKDWLRYHPEHVAEPRGLVEALREVGVTEGTIKKANDLLEGRTTPESYQGKPPPHSAANLTRQVLDEVPTALARALAKEMGERNEDLFRQLQQERERKAAEHAERQAEGQALAEARGLGAPAASRPAHAQKAK